MIEAIEFLWAVLILTLSIFGSSAVVGCGLIVGIRFGISLMPAFNWPEIHVNNHVLTKESET